jgi:2-polyprenyl-6-methoxyphenol hydroxylase-like FAD-dependent oxidoreductase
MTAQAARFPSFTLLRNAEAVDLLDHGGVVTGVRYRDATGQHDLQALLTVGADGRSSRPRSRGRAGTSKSSSAVWSAA